MSLSKCLDVSGNNRNLIVDQFLMDGLEMTISSEEVVITTKVPKKRTQKTPNSKFYNRLLECLDREEHPHMLRYVPNTNNRQFEVIFRDRKDSKNWDETDISLFMDLDKFLVRKFNRKRTPGGNDCKSRFRSNMAKCIRQNFVEVVSEEKIKSKTIKIYRILWRPGAQQSGIDREVAGSGGKSKRKLSKRTNKKHEKKNIVPGFDYMCSKKINAIVHYQEESKVPLKNESSESRNIIWEDFSKTLQSFGKMDLSRNHYSCLSSDSQMGIDGNVDFTLTNEDLSLIGEMDINNVLPVYYSGASTDVEIDISYGNSSLEKEIMNYQLFDANMNCGDFGFEKLDSNQTNAGMIYANVDDYQNYGVQSEENQNGKNRQEFLRDDMMDSEVLKTDVLLCGAQNETYDASNSVGEDDDFVNKFIRIGGAGGLYPSSV